MLTKELDEKSPVTGLCHNIYDNVYLVSERKPRSGTVLSFELKKERNLSKLEISKQN